MSHDHSHAYELSLASSTRAVECDCGPAGRIDALRRGTRSGGNDGSSVLLPRSDALAQRGADGLERLAEYTFGLGGSLSQVGTGQGWRYQWLRAGDRDARGV